jgi:predicted RNase H-like nuclease
MSGLSGNLSARGSVDLTWVRRGQPRRRERGGGCGRALALLAILVSRSPPPSLHRVSGTEAWGVEARSGEVLGVDGCPGGWVGALVAPDGGVRWWFWTIEQTDELLDAAPVVAIDMPIGLPEAGRRACDGAARERLGPARSSVFPVPSRPVLDIDEYATACRFAHERGEPAPSKQLWGLRPRIQRLDALMTPNRQAHVVECHPELAFTIRTGAVLPSKRTARGIGLRLAALGRTGAELADAPLKAGPDDALDALVCAQTARRWADGTAEVFGDDSRDRRGLRMQIVA